MAYSTDGDLQVILPDILELGIESFADEHARAKADILRELRINWWVRKDLSGDLDETKLTDSQFEKLSAYLVLWKYALPQLTNWHEDDRFQKMIEFYKARYGEELEMVLRDGIEYDADGNSIIKQEEKESVHHGRLTR